MAVIDIPRELKKLWDKYPQYEFIARLKKHKQIIEKLPPWCRRAMYKWILVDKINEMIDIIDMQQEQMKKLTQWDILWKWWHLD